MFSRKITYCFAMVIAKCSSTIIIRQKLAVSRDLHPVLSIIIVRIARSLDGMKNLNCNQQGKIACESSEVEYCMPALYYLQITGCLLHCHSTSSGDLSVQTSAIYWKHVSHIKVFPSTSNKSSILDTQVYWSHITQSQAETAAS